MRPNTPAQADYGLLFDVRRSVRYHDRRRAWFELLRRMAGLSALFLCAAVLFSAAGTAPAPPWLAALAISAGLVGVDVLAGFANSAARHQSLRARFIMLEASAAGRSSSQSPHRPPSHRGRRAAHLSRPRSALSQRTDARRRPPARFGALGKRAAVPAPHLPPVPLARPGRLTQNFLK